MYKLTFEKRVWIVKQVLRSMPQTNGKVERFFLSYKTEFATGTFTTVKDYVQHYNEKRLHMSLQYRTPKEVWGELKRK